MGALCDAVESCLASSCLLSNLSLIHSLRLGVCSAAQPLGRMLGEMTLNAEGRSRAVIS